MHVFLLRHIAAEQSNQQSIVYSQPISAETCYSMTDIIVHVAVAAAGVDRQTNLTLHCLSFLGTAVYYRHTFDSTFIIYAPRPDYRTVRFPSLCPSP